MMLKRLLIIDDEEEVLSVLRNLLSRYGFDIFTAEDQEGALDIARAEKVDVLILDMLLIEQDGYEVLDSFQKWFPDVPIVVLTGLALDEEFRSELRRAGAVASFEKSEPIENLVSFLRDLPGKEIYKLFLPQTETVDSGAIMEEEVKKQMDV